MHRSTPDRSGICRSPLDVVRQDGSPALALRTGDGRDDDGVQYWREAPTARQVESLARLRDDNATATVSGPTPTGAPRVTRTGPNPEWSGAEQDVSA